MAERIAVMGIRPRPGSIGPDGHHLRWMFPPRLGFPPKGFLVYRRPSIAFKPEGCLELTDVSTTLPSGGQVDDVHFYYPGPTLIGRDGTALSVPVVPNGVLELRFSRPMVHVVFDVSGIDAAPTLRAYAGAELVASSVLGGATSGTRRLEVTASYITRVTITLRFRRLHAVCFLSADAACALDDWKKGPAGDGPVKLPLVESPSQALARLEPGLANRYARDVVAATRRYEHEVADLIKALHLLQNPFASAFENPGASPHELRLTADSAESPLRGVPLQSALLLAALDPNIARFLSLYWVDADAAAPHGPDRDTRYDYKVVGTWKDRELCGLLLGFGQSIAHLPAVDETVEATQAAGLQRRNRQPLGRVAVRWPRPKPQHATEPVLFDVWRVVAGTGRVAFLTEKLPVLVDGSAWARPDATRFMDTGVPLDTYRYRLAGIDIFGQVGDPMQAQSLPLTVRDLAAPPPPVRLRVLPSATTPPAAIDLQFEFADAQDRQAPDIAGFKLYWRADSRVVRRRVHADAVSRDGRPDGPGIYAVKIVSEDPLSLADFVGGVLDGARADSGLVAAAARRRYRVADVAGPDVIRLVATAETFTEGDYDLVSDPNAIAGWKELSPEITARPPHVGRVLSVDDFRAHAAHVRTLEPPPDVLGMLPAARRPETVSVPTVLEVLLDRALLEPGLFTGGTARVGGVDYPILYSTSGPAFVDGHEIAARIGLPAAAVVASNAELTLIAPSGDPPMRVQRLRIEGTPPSGPETAPGGEAAFESAHDVTHVARVVSDTARRAGDFDILVRMSPDASAALRPGVTRGRYFVPYHATVRIDPAAGTTARTIPLEIPSGEARRVLYLAASAYDARGNPTPPRAPLLSTPVDLTLVRAAPSGRPGPPFPCGFAADAAAGYTTPPNRQGRATVCLQWDRGTVAPADGLRYDLARTTDVAILAAHRRNWLLGRALVEFPVVAGPRREGTMSAVTFDATRGLYRATVASNPEDVPADAFSGGRLVQPPLDPASPNVARAYFQITRASGTLDLLLRPMGQTAPAPGPCTVEALPEFEAARDDVGALRRLAEENGDAFGVVTGVPVSATQFTDEVPGVGRNRFFYRVRAVDRAENRSAWSAVSAPFHQVDTTPPPAPIRFGAVPGDRVAVLSWRPSTDPRITRYRLFRSVDGEAFDPLTTTPHADIPVNSLVPRALRALAGTVTLPGSFASFVVPSGIAPDAVVTGLAAGTIVRLTDDGDLGPSLFDPVASRLVFDVRHARDGTTSLRVTALAGLRPHPAGAPLTITMAGTRIANDPSFATWTDVGLEGGVTYVYRVAAVGSVTAAGVGASTRTLAIAGHVTDPFLMTAIDRSVPAAPVIVAFEWIDAGGVTLTTPVPGARLRLTLDAASAPAQTLVQRGSAPSGPWSAVPLAGGRSWVDWPPASTRLVVHDEAPSPAVAPYYSVLSRTRDGRTSLPGPTVAIVP